MKMNKTKKKSETQTRKRRPGELLVILLPAIAVVIVAVAVRVLIKNESTYTISDPAYQYYAGSAFPIQNQASLQTDADGSVVMNVNGEDQKVADLPIYYESRRSILLPEAMVFYVPREDFYAQAERFTEVLCEENGTVHFIKGEKDNIVQNGFLFDGMDFYLFLEPVTLRFNGYTISLPALSYVEAIYSGDVMVFNYETRECFMESPTGDVLAEVVSGDYTISLLNDSITLYDGSKTLLFTRPELLNPVS